MARVDTVNGPVESSHLGRTLVDEHVFVLGTELRQNYGDWDHAAHVDDAVAKLDELKALGIDTILDPTVIGLGRYLPHIQRVAARTTLDIVVATGLYTYNELPFQFHYAGPGLLFDVAEPLTAMFVRDLTEGIADTGVRAAFLKCAIEHQGLTPGSSGRCARWGRPPSRPAHRSRSTRTRSRAPAWSLSGCCARRAST
jgi:phosphotriesterase-related protein